MKSVTNTIAAVLLFSMAMAALESAVVVYLRALYYPQGFTVAMKIISEDILITELIREAATIIMLATLGYLAGSTKRERLAYFLLSFAIWDIFYYVWLKAFIDWPASLFEWDILFLIPFTWLGPVLAPVLCSLTMILMSVVLLLNDPLKKIPATAWGLVASGTLVILFTFMKDYGAIIIDNGLIGDYANIMKNENFLAIASSYVPESFNWVIFLLGEALICLGIVRIYLGVRRKHDLIVTISTTENQDLSTQIRS
jgi:hypothetical protein